MGLALFSSGAACADEVTATVHFALIRPEADPANDQPAPAAEAAWLSRPRATSRNTSSADGTQKSKLRLRAGEKSQAVVAPLKRERPKSETDPPKTRRRQLGW
jgi:hypothetical protein